MRKILTLAILAIFAVGTVHAQCIPSGPRPVTGTITGANGTMTFNNVPNGNVIQIIAPSGGIVYDIDMCATNPAGTADGVNDSYLTMLDLNNAAATALLFADDGCTTNVPMGWGPTTMTWGSTVAGATFLYMTEYDAGGANNCIADGLNNAYDITITWAGAGPCEAGTLSAVAVQNVCPGDSGRIDAIGMLAGDGGFGVGFDDSPGGTGGLAGGFTIIGIDETELEYAFDAGINGIMAANALPDLAGSWLVKVYALDAANDPCDSTATITVNFLDAADPLCAPVGFDAAVIDASLGEYTSVPLSQVTPIIPSCVVANTGGSTVTNVSVSAVIRDESNAIVYTATNNVVGSLAVGNQVTIADIGAGFTPTTTEFFLAEFIVSITEADNDITNDTLFTGILIEDSLYARDFATLVGGSALFNALGVGAGFTAQFGNVFDVVNATELVSAEVFLNATLPIGDTVRAHVYDMAGGLPNTIIGSTPNFIVTAADTPTLNLVLSFNPPINLAAGEYFVAVEEFNSTDNIGCLTSESIYTANKTLGNINGGAFDDISALGVAAQVFLVRANMFDNVPTPCDITAITAGTQSACDVLNNNYTQDVVVTYSNEPATGMLTVNGQNFPITGSPQTVTLTGLTSNGAAVNVTAAFTDDLACNITQNALFTAPVSCFCAGYTVTPSLTNETCQSSNGTINLTVTGGTGALNYAWSPNVGSGASVTGLSAGNYSVTITDDVGCPETFMYTLTNTGTIPVLTLSATDVTNCAAPNGTATVVSSNPIQSVVWSPSAQITPTAVGLGAGMQTVTVADADGCIATGSISVGNVAGAVTAVLQGSTNVSCFGLSDGAIDITIIGGTGTITYNWSDIGVPSLQQDRTNLPAGNYTVEVTDGNSCTFTLGPINITQPPMLQLAVNSFDAVSCNGQNDGSIVVTGAGGTAPLMYSKDGIVFQGSSTFNNLTPGNYTITVEDANGCTMASPSIPITEPAVLSLVLNNTTDVDCNGDMNGGINVSGSGGTNPLSYTINGGASQNNGAFNNLDGGSYTVVVTDANGCTAMVSAMVNEPDAIDVTVLAVTDVDCNGNMNGAIDVNATGGSGNLMFNWGAGNPTTQDLSNLSGGTYNLVVSDANNCTVSIAPVTVAEPSALSLTISTTPESASGAEDGTATVSQMGGTPNYTYLWTPGGQTTSAAVGLANGTYSVTVTDANGCNATISDDVELDVTSIGEVNVANLVLYPNPTNGIVTVSFETAEKMNVTFNLYNAIGKTVLSESHSAIIGGFSTSINLSELAAGIYLLEIENETGKTVRKITLN